MNQLDRLNMLKHISFIGKKNLNIFDSYIPHHYDEIYTLYTLLEDSGIKYDEITFLEPEETDYSFTFNCCMSNKLNTAIREYLKHHEIVKYLRNKSFKINFTYGKESTKIKFIRVQDGD